jgi:hypothetical protein
MTESSSVQGGDGDLVTKARRCAIDGSDKTNAQPVNAGK